MAETCDVCRGTKWEEFTDDKQVRRVRKCTGCTAWKVGDPPGLPQDERGATLAAMDLTTGFPADAVRQAQLFIDGVHPGLYIYGSAGTGKTRLACAILNDVYKRPGGPTALFVRTLDLLDRLRASFDGDDVSILDDASAAGVLVLDDVGTQKAGSDFARRTLQMLYDRRLDAGLRTIWTANYDLDALATLLAPDGGDDRLTSRIAGYCKLVAIECSDYRLYQAKVRDRSYR